MLERVITILQRVEKAGWMVQELKELRGLLGLARVRMTGSKPRVTRPIVCPGNNPFHSAFSARNSHHTVSS
ncbi:hypothetical protein RRG08_017155 [Elysia crispata]|uniref:Uncharacterized protein n=1 Tax=Elysia crispata TaxID=231223 RepID=A0AAE1E9A6_9GAST|nr:hypothetical protein RRG08_017155 [Elysia crispata]